MCNNNVINNVVIICNINMLSYTNNCYSVKSCVTEKYDNIEQVDRNPSACSV